MTTRVRSNMCMTLLYYWIWIWIWIFQTKRKMY